MEEMNGYPASGRRLHAAVILSLALVISASAALLAACAEKKVSLRYDGHPGLAIVTVEAGGGLPYPGDDLLPLFQLFGDGRFVAYDESAMIFVEGKLDEKAVADLLQRIADTGFFALEDEYRDPEVYDATYRRIAVDLAETQKTVTVWMLNHVPDFDKAYDLILSFPRGEVSDYVPDRGYLVVARYPGAGGQAHDLLDPDSDIFKLLPDAAALSAAADSHTAVAVDGDTFLRLKKYDSAQNSRGLRISQPEGVLVVYPVYEPRTADKP